MGRRDVFLTEDDRVYIDESNTLPGFTASSRYPLRWQEAGRGYGELIARLVDLALERHQERTRG